MAENAIEKAALEGASQIEEKHIEQIIQSGYDEVATELSLSHVHILRFLAKEGESSPSDPSFQQEIHLGRTRIRYLLEELFEKGYVLKEKKDDPLSIKFPANIKPIF